MYKFFFKRFLDILLSFIALAVLSPLLIPVCIGLLLTGEHYVFYLQKRVGYKNKMFNILKFATMLKSSPSLGTGSITLKNDWRLTPMGKFLRSTKINEIPQLVNILMGDMSIVGPRPLMKVDFLKFTPEIQAVFYNSRPGLTSISSIIFRNEQQYYVNIDMDLHDFSKKYLAPYKGELELWHQRHQSLYADLIIIILTLYALVVPENDLVFRIFKDLPERPQVITDYNSKRQGIKTQM